MNKDKIVYYIVLALAICALIYLIITSPAVKSAINARKLQEERLRQKQTAQEVVILEENTNELTENTLDIINNANEVKIKEEIFSFNKVYNIYIKNEKVASISGKYINMTGDVFTLKDNMENILMSEKQIRRWGIKLNRAAQIYDANGNTIRLFWRR